MNELGIHFSSNFFFCCCFFLVFIWGKWEARPWNDHIERSGTPQVWKKTFVFSAAERLLWHGNTVNGRILYARKKLVRSSVGLLNDEEQFIFIFGRGLCLITSETTEMANQQSRKRQCCYVVYKCGISSMIYFNFLCTVDVLFKKCKKLR